MKDMFARRLGAFFLDILQVLVFAVSIFLFVYLLLVQPHKIKGSSMDPNFHDGEFLLTDKVTYRFGEPEQGDVVVFKAPPDDAQEFIKRIIAKPGDTVKVEGGRVFVNGQLLNETYLEDSVVTRPGNYAQESREVTIPAGNYFVMGDNRNHSYDSRNFGPIDRSKITGRAWLLYWPLPDAGIIHRGVYGAN
jgi:signal peptidase I